MTESITKLTWIQSWHLHLGAGLIPWSALFSILASCFSFSHRIALSETLLAEPLSTWNLPSSYTSCRLNPHDWLDRLCVYGIYKRTLRAPTKENTLFLIAVDIGGKKTQEYDQIRIWAAPRAGLEISTVLEGILGRWGGLWLPARERTLTAVTHEKHLFFLCFDLFCRLFWIFFSFCSYTVVIYCFFPLSHIVYCCYKPLPLHWAFAVLWSFPFLKNF